MAKLFLITASSRIASEHYESSLIEGVPLEQLVSLSDVYEDLESHAENGRVFAWGARPGAAAEQKWSRLEPGDVALVYRAGEFRLWARLIVRARSASVAADIWGTEGGVT